MNVKRFFGHLLIALAIICSLPLHLLAQKDTRDMVDFTPNKLLDNVFDLRGNKFSLGEIAINDKVRSFYGGVPMMSISSGCSSGYFQLYLETGCGMEGTDPVSVARLNVLCQVLNDISAFISSPCSITGQKINIWVKKSITGGAGGVATPFFNIPYSPTASGIVDNTIWETLNSGKDAFTGVVGPLGTSGGGSSGSTFFHGSIAFNFSSSMSWHTDLSTPPAAGEWDMYTVALHEMTHAMGFATLVDYNGQSVIGPGYKYYTRYDTHIKTPSGAPLITTATPTCDMYGWDINPILSPISATLSPGGTTACPSGYAGGSSDNTICAHRLEYAGGFGTNIPLYTPECFEKGSSLSHFEDECYVPAGFVLGAAGLATNNQYFTMSNAGAPGPYSATTNPAAMKRKLTPEERMVLCDIGYNVGTTFGSAANLNYINYGGTACSASRVVGFNDGLSPSATFVYTVSSTGGLVNINPPTSPLLGNDFGVTGGSFKCLQVVVGASTVSTTSGTASTTVLFTPTTGTHGVQLLRYIPVSSTGVEGNITYVYVYVVDNNCVPSACNLVSNGGFENTIPYYSGPWVANATCWENWVESPDYFSRGCTTSPTWCFPFSYWFIDGGDTHSGSASANDHYIGFLSARDASFGPFSEGAQGRLSSSLINGNGYELGFWARIADNASGWETQPTNILFGVGTTVPLTPTSGFATSLPAGVTTLASFEVTHPDISWHYYSKQFTYSGPVDASSFVIIGAPWLNSTILPGGNAEYVVVDDISLTPLSEVCTVGLPDTINACDAINLTTIVTIPSGTFSWERDSSGVAVTTHSSVFDPGSARAASLDKGGVGIVQVSYVYTTPSGCIKTAYKEVYIGSLPTAPIIGTTLLCPGATTTLTTIATGGTWGSSNLSVATIDMAGIVTGVATGTSLMTYTPTIGCYGVATITVGTPPADIVGAPLVCSGSAITMTDPSPGGIWGSSNTAVASVNASTGVVSGMGTGSAVISYCTSTLCWKTITVMVSPLPTAIAGASTVCAGASTILTNTVPGGSWSSSNLAVATVSSAGTVTGVSPGTATISYTVSAGCFKTKEITVNPAPAIIAGPLSLCIGAESTLSSATTGGTWSSSNPIVSAVSSAGTITGAHIGLATISYTIANGCSRTAIVTVNPIPPAIAGLSSVCEGASVLLTDIWSGGTWSLSTPLASIDAVTGLVTGLSAGTTAVTYSLATGCFITTTVTVVPLPAMDLIGSPLICLGETSAWSASIAGGVWSSNNPAVATVDAGGDIHGIAAGTATISYLLSSGCFKVQEVTVDPVTPAIAGSLSLTKGNTSTLSDPAAGGTWTSSNTAVATIGATTGIVTGIASGTSGISYVLPGQCIATVVVTVNPPAGILPTGHSAHTIAVIPNPNKGTFTIQGTVDNSFEGTDAAVEVIDVLGRTITKDATVVKNAALRKEMTLGRDLSTGVYFIRVRVGDNIEVARFLLENGVPK